MTNHPNRSNRYIVISPRGFGNEIVVRFGSAEAVEIAAQIINNDVNAWAERVSSKDARVRAAKRERAEFVEWYGEAAAERDSGSICRLSEADVSDHRPTMLPDYGPRYLGGPALPADYQ